MQRDFWREKKVLITGHTGFKGAWLASWLNKLGSDVTGFALPPDATQPMYDAIDLASGITSTFGDVNDLDALTAAMKSAAPDIVFHLAAQPLVQLSYQQPVSTFMTNLMGTTHVLEALRVTKTARAAVIITTDKVYQNEEWEWGYREIDRLGGDDPYSASKACAELVTNSYIKSFYQADTGGPSIATARAGNVIGGGDWAHNRLVPDIIRSVKDQGQISLRNPNATRPWQFVLEPLYGYLHLAERLFTGETVSGGGWNFGPERKDAWPVQKMVTTLLNLMNLPAEWDHDNAGFFPEKRLLHLDISKAKDHLDWSPKMDTKDALAMTAEWYLDWMRNADMRQTTHRQIEAYEAMIFA